MSKDYFPRTGMPGGGQQVQEFNLPAVGTHIPVMASNAEASA